MKIGLCTPYKILNYGTKLQAYAAQKKIESLGYDVEIINFVRRSDLRPNKLFHRYFNKEFIYNKLNQHKYESISDDTIRIGIKKRIDAINSFDMSHYHTTPLIKGFRGLVKQASNYSAVICGSDQIWLPSNVYNPTVTLEFAPPGCKRIAFAPSFGISSIPKNKKREFQKFLRNLDSISVREQSGRNIVKDLIGEDVPVVLDPTLTIDSYEWRKLADTGRKIVTEDYVFCYFLGTNIEHRKYVQRIAKEKGWKIVTLPHFIEYNEYDEIYADYKLYDVTPCDFLRLIKEAKAVCTDSFHASVFSIIFQKPFFAFERFTSNDQNSTNSRICSLLILLGLEKRLIKNILDSVEFHYDFLDVQSRLEKLRESTDIYLKNAFMDVKREQIVNKKFIKPIEKNCCGCSACASACPQNCLEMVADDKTGFMYPVLYDEKKCINCGLCNSVCPMKQERNVSHSISNAFYAQNSKKKIRRISASGGVFASFAQTFIKEGGLVCAAKYNEKFEVFHDIISDETELKSLIGSKYSESNLNNCFNRIENLLKSGKSVLFCGTPCEARGLTNFLKRSYNNLFIIDLLCYGIQSPLAWQSYLSSINKNDEEIVSVNMRDKSTSWQEYSMKICFANGEEYISEKSKDPYLKSYATGLFLRPSCYECQLKAFPRCSDITIGDFWDIDYIIPEKNDGQGASIVIPQTKKGESYLKYLFSEGIIVGDKIDMDKLNEVHPLFCLGTKKNRNSRMFFEMLQDSGQSFDLIIGKCMPSQIETFARKTYRKIRSKLK